MRSHTEKEVRDALERGEEVWLLDTDGDGEDDVLIGDWYEVMEDIFYHFGMDKFPPRWELRKVE